MTASGIYQLGINHLREFNVRGLMPALKHCNGGAINDVLNTNGCAYYQWIPGIIEELKPKQIVELGGAMGVWDLCTLHCLPEDSKLYSITLAEGGLEFSYVKDTYPNFVPVVGDDLDLNNWPKDIDLSQTDLWFFDALHTEKHLRAELELYSPFFKKGAVVLFDDIHMDELQPVWDDIVEGKYGITDAYDATNPLHWSGYGVCVV